ncbi:MULTISPECIES: iron hydrogenase small subunit [Campylobacter]|uniref:iron hydrogenase small subunit n=1 Tax=Campylobacter TaxID=194 RepID=UPI0023F34B19|nr:MULTISPECIES: iron hydrogenase small subunit [Campylobacter]MCI6641899.1 iron hydrogenase small subunit [Campylobacter sp.]MDD7422021.1 iron hydrogenase small subunit [Campylobacter hominis]MDY3116595.1 iron hydrogenase small subunit [Campylobacter hominis]
MLSRRDFLKVAGVGISNVAITGYALTDIIEKRKSYIAMRQEGLYKDEKKDFKKQNLTASNQNSSCMKVYTMGEVIEELLHTNYVDIIMDKVLKFPVSEKIFHNVNLVSWIFLVISGIIIYFKLADNEILKLLMDLHIAVAVVFSNG